MRAGEVPELSRTVRGVHGNTRAFIFFDKTRGMRVPQKHDKLRGFTRQLRLGRPVAYVHPTHRQNNKVT
jgi:hypothetical protein